MPLSREHVESKKLAKIKIFLLARSELLFNLCYEIPCTLYIKEVHRSFILGQQLVMKHRVTKIGVFVHCSVSECLANQQNAVLELGLSVALFELNRRI